MIANGSLYVFGKEGRGRLGVGPFKDIILQPTPLKYINRYKIIGVAAGQYHTLAWDSNGILFSWGDASDG